jgi:hypothetical protein
MEVRLNSGRLFTLFMRATLLRGNATAPRGVLTMALIIFSLCLPHVSPVGVWDDLPPKTNRLVILESARMLVGY